MDTLPLEVVGVIVNMDQISKVVLYCTCKTFRSLLVDLPARSHVWWTSAFEGRMSVLETFNEYLDIAPTEDACSAAAEGGQLEALIWLRERDFPWDDEVTQFATYNGYLELLRWALENACPAQNDLRESAAHGGHVDVLQFLKERGFQSALRECNMAADGGHLEALIWSRQNGSSWNGLVYQYAAFSHMS